MESPTWQAAHAEALRRGEESYRDPETGYSVFTEATLRARGKCCGAACRHCPYGHANVPGRRRKAGRRREEGPRHD